MQGFSEWVSQSVTGAVVRQWQLKPQRKSEEEKKKELTR